MPGPGRRFTRRLPFAFIYIGTLVDQESNAPLSEDLSRELTADMTNASEARQTAVDWGLVSGVGETNPFAHIGYKLASRILRTDRALIDALTSELLTQETLDREALQTWLDTHAHPIAFEHLENETSF